jgi:signal transduction histidine kinase/CheY-like chemotaxis protein
MPPAERAGSPDRAGRARRAGLAATAGLVVAAGLFGLSGSLAVALPVAAGLPVLLWLAASRFGEAARWKAEMTRLAATVDTQADTLARTEAELERRTREADSLLGIALATGTTLDETELLRHVATGAAQACRARRCTIWLLDESEAWLTPAMSQFAEGTGDQGIGAAAAGHGPLRLEAVPFLQEAVATRTPVLIADAAADVRVPRSWAEAFELRSLLALPLSRLGRAVGVMVLDYGAPASPGAAGSTSLAVALAEQVALALHSAGLYADAEARRREAEIMAEVVATIDASLDLDTVLARIAEGARELCQSEVAAVGLRDSASQVMLLRYRTGGPRGTGEKGAAGERAAAGEASPHAGAAAAGGDGPGPRPLLGTDPRGKGRQAGEEYVTLMREEGLVAVLVVPIRSGEAVEGLLYVGNRSPRPFSARHRAVLARLADHAAIALKNARLFDAAQRRVARMTRLTALSQGLASCLDYPRLRSLLTSAALDLLGGETARLWLLTETGRGLRLAASAERERAPGREPAAELAVGDGLVGWVVAHRTRRYSPNLPRDPRVSSHEWTAIAGHASQLVVPLVAGDRPVGALAVLSRRRSAFAPEDEELLELFAAQAAAALENARLYEAAQDAYDELARTQHQLLHSQKMEAVGRLAGGVAHDFNNLLTVIRGRAEYLSDSLPADDPLRREADLILETGDRAAALTRQLLTLSRKQVRRLTRLDLDAVVAAMEEMLLRTIGEDVAVELVLGGDVGHVLADGSQVEQVVLNLAVNARDAMPRGGTLTIRTGEAVVAADGHPAPPPGRYVTLEVRDTGVGMDEATRQRIFEPFFTTKDPGKGTGLGLATVYAVVQQSGGHVEVESAPGQGATFRVYLPRMEDGVEPETPGGPPAGPDTGRETILLVEDEAAVRRLAREGLGARGYRVLEAAKGAEALELAAQHRGPIHLLLTDVVMPGMSGAEVAARIVALRPTTQMLYVSGYPDDALGPHGVLAPGIAFLAKPFTVGELARKVRQVLDGAAAHKEIAHSWRSMRP